MNDNRTLQQISETGEASARGLIAEIDQWIAESRVNNDDEVTQFWILRRKMVEEFLREFQAWQQDNMM
jgi:hypothetical protein